MNSSESIGQLAAALAAAEGKMLAASMNSVNPFFKSKYADLGSIIEAIRPTLAENGLSFTQLPTTEENTISLETVILHSSGEWISSSMTVEIANEKGVSTIQSVGKTITYLRRYAISAMFGVYADNDDDGNDAMGKPAARKPAQPARQQNEPEPEPVQNLTDGELLIKEASAEEFFDLATSLISRYNNSIATKNAAKLLGYKAIPAFDYARVEMFRAIRDRAAARDAEEAEAELKEAAAENPDSIHAA